MLINRHNYEEYFILYMDNELSDADRRAVEAFVQKNPDLRDELDSLLQYKMEPDDSIRFSGKEDLLKINGETPITHTNYQEWLLLCADNELSAAQESQVMDFIAANPAIQKEWEQIRQCRMQPDTAIVFAGKESLYRKEEKVRPLLPRWWRIAAAAVLLIGAGLTTTLLINNKGAGEGQSDGLADGTKIKTSNSTVNVPATDASKQQAVPANNTASVSNDATPQTAPAQTDYPVKNTPYKTTEPVMAVNTPQPVNNNLQNGTVQQPEKTNQPLVNPGQQQEKENTGITRNTPVTPSNNLPTPENNPNYTASNKNNDAIAKTNTPDEVKNAANTLTTQPVTTQPDQTSGVVQASFQENGKKNKLRGLFRKITRTFEKRTNTESEDGNDRLLIAGLSIKMK